MPLRVSRASRKSAAVRGTYAYYEASVLHRADGPAVRRSDGAEEWCLDGQQLGEPALM